jgi:hypothetical protein
LFKDEVPDLVIRKRAWTQCVEEFNPSMWASLHCTELFILHTIITDPNYFFDLIIVHRWYEDQVASPYSGEQVLSQGI